MPTIVLTRTANSIPTRLQVQSSSRLFPSQDAGAEVREFDWHCPSCDTIAVVSIVADTIYMTRMDRFLYPPTLFCSLCNRGWYRRQPAVVGGPGGVYLERSPEPTDVVYTRPATPARIREPLGRQSPPKKSKRKMKKEVIEKASTTRLRLILDEDL